MDMGPLKISPQRSPQIWLSMSFFVVSCPLDNGLHQNLTYMYVPHAHDNVFKHFATALIYEIILPDDRSNLSVLSIAINLGMYIGHSKHNAFNKGHNFHQSVFLSHIPTHRSR